MWEVTMGEPMGVGGDHGGTSGYVGGDHGGTYGCGR